VALEGEMLSLDDYLRKDDVDIISLYFLSRDDFGPNRMIDGNSLLTMSAREGAINCLKMLLHLKADCNPKEGRQPLHEALSFGHPACATALIEAGALYNNPEYMQDILLGLNFFSRKYDGAGSENFVDAIIKRFLGYGYEDSLECLFVKEEDYKVELRAAREKLRDRVLELLIERVKERGYEPSLKPFLEKHPDYQTDPIIHAGVLKYIEEEGYHESLDALFEKEQTLFAAAVSKIIERADRKGYEESLFLFIKSYPLYGEHAAIQKAFRERAVSVGYEWDKKGLAVLSPCLFRAVMEGLIKRSYSVGYEPALQVFIDEHQFEDLPEKDVLFLQGLVSEHREREAVKKSVKIKKESKPYGISYFFSEALALWRGQSTGSKEGSLSSEKQDKQALLKAH
jgi:hypothetical protein